MSMGPLRVELRSTAPKAARIPLPHGPALTCTQKSR